MAMYKDNYGRAAQGNPAGAGFGGAKSVPAKKRNKRSAPKANAKAYRGQ